MKPLLRSLSKFLVVAGLLFAVATAGFAHHFSPKDADQEIAAFLESIGVDDDFCGDFEGSPHGDQLDCEACRLFANAALSGAPDQFAPARLGAVLVLCSAHPARLAATQLDPSRQVRGPPVI